MDERAPIVLTKIVVLLFLFPLCQLGSEFKIQSAAELSGYYPTSPLGTVNVSRLPNEEVEAFNKIVLSLELVPVFRMKETSCDEDQFLSSIFIGCTESDNNNERHINNITMESARLTGKIPEYVADLTYLEKLDLSNNKLSGSIPDELGDLSNLTILDLSQNRLTGNIPSSLGKLKNLRELSLFQNLLSGNIPASLGSLSSLTILRLWANILSGPIPAELGNLTQLRRLALDENGLTGKAPPELGKLSNLRHLGISSNNIIGELPKEYDNLRNLEIFAVCGNSLSGAIPRYIANWKNLSVLDLIGNDFKGELPQEIFNMSNLEILRVANLKNPGLAFPISANLTSIFTLILRDCNITGVIPSYISDWSSQSLKNLDLSFNDLSGGIPDGFKQASLYKLFLTGNMLNGTFPTWIYKTVEVLGDISYNNFTFPDELQMDLGYNNPKNATDLHQTKINIEPRNKTFDQEIMQKHCNREKPKYHSLFINAGAEEITIERNRYEADNSTSNFYVSPEYNWAYSCSGHFLRGFTNSSDFVAKQKCGVFFNAKDASLHSKARLCPQSLTYYGFCLHEGSYNVTLHFSEIIFSKDEDLSSPGRRVFDIYIQDKLELKDFNIKEDAKGADETLTKNFTVNVTNNLLKIKLLWNGKGSQYRNTYLHGPLISAISVTSNFKVGGKSKIWIMEMALASVALGLLLLVLMWRMGWIGDRELHDSEQSDAQRPILYP
ncbi:Leucine-rich repeat receptor-like protein kinase family protein [Melia azedarach]|uniref:Leucine-rich repeat receptor-like protein kinase family protein n=1 Tax=Melia azedarach TaxID=155640 RepID=A0ACC1Y0X9_MELAZ|nr:Leucine-rich repeat receptor-like protein kinase family protein [Melia azedarach]